MDFVLNFDEKRITFLENLFLDNEIDKDIKTDENLDLSILNYLESKDLIDEDVNIYKEDSTKLFSIVKKIINEKKKLTNLLNLTLQEKNVNT